MAGVRIGDSSRATPVELPPRVRRFDMPRVAASSGDALAVVWQGGITLEDTVVSSLWFATLGQGVWSSPDRVGPIIDMGITTASGLVSHGENLAIAVQGKGGVGRLYARVRRQWKAHELGRSYLLYNSLAAVGDTLWLGAIDGQGVTVARLGFDGTVGRPVLVAPYDGSHYVQLVATGPGELAVAWVQFVGENGMIHAARSRDGGATWARAKSIEVPGGVQSFDAIGRDGVVYVTGRQGHDAGPWPFVARLKGDDWRILPVPQTRREIAVVPPRFSRQEAVVDLFWAADDRARMDREPPAVVRVRLRSDCKQ